MWLLTLYRSTIGKKVIMAVTGLMMVVTLVVGIASLRQPPPPRDALP